MTANLNAANVLLNTRKTLVLSATTNFLSSFDYGGHHDEVANVLRTISDKYQGEKQTIYLIQPYNPEVPEHVKAPTTTDADFDIKEGRYSDVFFLVVFASPDTDGIYVENVTRDVVASLVAHATAEGLRFVPQEPYKVTFPESSSKRLSSRSPRAGRSTRSPRASASARSRSPSPVSYREREYYDEGKAVGALTGYERAKKEDFGVERPRRPPSHRATVGGPRHNALRKRVSKEKERLQFKQDLKNQYRAHATEELADAVEVAKIESQRATEAANRASQAAAKVQRISEKVKRESPFVNPY